MGYRYSKYSTNIINVDKVVLANRGSGQWIRISKEVYDILNLGIENNYSIEQLKLSLYDDADRKYIYNLYKKLISIGVIEDEKNKVVLKNKRASFEITNRCNLRCIHCYIDADGLDSDKVDLSTDEIKKVIDKLIQWNPERISLTGGEPMLRKDFFDILRYLRLNYDGNIGISTNGTLINNKNIDELSKNINQIDISIDGIDEKTCSDVRGPGVFNKVVESVKLFRSRDFNEISLSMAFGNKNIHLESKFIELNTYLGTTPIVRQFEPIGRGFENREFFSDKKITKSGLSDKFLNGDFNKEFNSCSCSAGKREVYISHKGDIYPCQSFLKDEYKIDNILEIDSLDNLKLNKNKCTEGYKNIEKFFPENNKECKDCKVNLFCWPCPGELSSIKDNEEAFQDTCKKIKPILYKQIWG
ncbi:radical SAM protein [Clostridioides difficile]